jgi:hypothetical protein
MKRSLFLVLSIVIASTTVAQTISYDDFKQVIPLIQKEDFKAAFEKTRQLLKDTKYDSSSLRAIVTYMNLYAAAGMVSLNQMTHAELKKLADTYVGQFLLMPAHPCIDSNKHGFNSLTFSMVNGEWEGETTSANDTKTSIFFFENFRYADKIDPSELIGKMVRCGGTLESVETNPNESTIWIARLRIREAFARAVNSN